MLKRLIGCLYAPQFAFSRGPPAFFSEKSQLLFSCRITAAAASETCKISAYIAVCELQLTMGGPEGPTGHLCWAALLLLLPVRCLDPDYLFFSTAVFGGVDTDLVLRVQCQYAHLLAATRFLVAWVTGPCALLDSMCCRCLVCWWSKLQVEITAVFTANTGSWGKGRPMRAWQHLPASDMRSVVYLCKSISGFQLLTDRRRIIASTGKRLTIFCDKY